MRKKIYFIVLAILVIINLFNIPGSVEEANNIDTGDTAWMLVSAALVLLMTPGLAFFYGGMVNKKNIISTMLQSFVLVVLLETQLLILILTEFHYHLTLDFLKRFRFYYLLYFN